MRGGVVGDGVSGSPGSYFSENFGGAGTLQLFRKCVFSLSSSWPLPPLPKCRMRRRILM
jgi:hypothetical protein